MTHTFNEIYLRTIFKMITWRILQIIVYVVNTLLVTGNLVLGIKLAGAALVVNSTMYWFHERLWNMTDWARVASTSKFTEKQWRTIGKMISWRVLMIISVFLIAFITTGAWEASIKIMSSIIVVNIVMYWLHERTWLMLTWGKKVNTQE